MWGEIVKLLYIDNFESSEETYVIMMPCVIIYNVFRLDVGKQIVVGNTGMLSGNSHFHVSIN